MALLQQACWDHELTDLRGKKLAEIFLTCDMDERGHIQLAIGFRE